MKSIEYYLIQHYLFEKFFKSFISSPSIDLDKGSLEVQIALGDKTKKYSIDLLKYLIKGFEDTYEVFVGTELIREGYYLLTIEGGWIVTKEGTEGYQLGEESCTCKDFVYSNHKCKHLMFRDMMVKYNSRVKTMQREAYLNS